MQGLACGTEAAQYAKREGGREGGIEQASKQVSKLKSERLGLEAVSAM